MRGERRRYPRIRTRLAAEVLKPDGTVVQGTISDLSSTGVQVACSPEEAKRFQTRGEQIEVRIRFDVPAPGVDEAPVSASCKLVFTRRVAADEFCVGLNFAELDDESFANLAAFMESRL